MLESFIRSRREAKVQREAAEWIARLHSDQCSEDDRSRFHLWRTTSDVHARIFRDAELAWGDLRFAPILAPATVAANHRRGQSDQYDISGVAGFWSRRRLIAAFGGTAVAAIGGGGLFAWSAAAATTIYETKHGESRHITVGSGLSFDLDVLSRVKVHNDGSQIQVENGRVRITAKSQPTIIRFGGHDLKTSAAQVDIECSDSELVRMLLVSGTGMLGQGDGSELPLKAPCMVDGTTMMVTTPDTQLLTRLTSWSSGRVIFENDRLSDAVALMNRYDKVQLRLRDSKLSGLEISGMFRLGDNRRFAESVQELLPVSVADRSGELLLAPIPSP